DGVAVLLHIELQRGLQLPADCVKAGPGKRHADADLERRFRGSAAGEQPRRRSCRHPLEHRSTLHLTMPPSSLSCRRLSRASTFLLSCARCLKTRMAGTSPAMASRTDYSAASRWGISGRSPSALPVIGGLGKRASPRSITKLCSSEYHGGLT